MAPADDGNEARLVTISDVKDILEREQGSREDLTYEQKLALDHATHFVKVDAETSHKMVEKLMELGGRVTDWYAYRIADIVPRHEDDVRAIFARERSAPDAEDIEKILAVVREFAP